MARPDYGRDAQTVGIVHFGIGAFHRAHQAWYTDRAMAAGDCNWAITGVSLRSTAVADQLNPQDGLYSLTERSAAGNQTRVIGAIKNVLVASSAPAAVTAAVAAPGTRIVSFTVTEKGYCRAADGSLDFVQAGTGSIYRFLAEALRQRHDTRLPGLTLLSCDNLTDNGGQLARLMREYLERHDPALGSWFEAECACPSTMVDRIVPATTAADRAEVARAIGLDDFGAVLTEPFSQWVIEDRFAGPHPAWQQVGAQFVSDVAAYETAKLRLLNGAHSLLAYCGLRHGHRYVHEAVADPALLALVRQLMLEEAAITVPAAPDLDLSRYAEALLDRFANPELGHRLAQIAIDGSQKVPQRWLETLVINRKSGRACPAILAGIAAWIEHLKGRNGPVDDPLAAQLGVAVRGREPLLSLFGSGGIVASDWSPNEYDRKAVAAWLE